MLNKLQKNQNGNIAIVFALFLPVIIYMLGVAVDFANLQYSKAKLQNALDSACLATVKNLNTNTTSLTPTQFAQKISQQYFNTMIPAKVLAQLNVKLNPANVVINQDSSTATLYASATEQTTFLSIFGSKQINLNISSTVTVGNSGFEIVLAVDNSGSMNDIIDTTGVPKITALKNAANLLVSTIFTGNTEPDNLFMGVVPFTQAVNIGTNHANWLNTAPTNFPSRAPWYGCVNARTQPLDMNDTTPNSKTNGVLSMFQAYYYPNSNSAPLTPSEMSNFNIWRNTNPYELDGTLVGPNNYCPQAMLPMTNNKTALIDNINTLTAQGDTLINQGVAWSERMLSPKWNGLWGTTMDSTGSPTYPSLPLNYNTHGMQKVLILMTDGWNHVLSNNYTAYGFLDQGQIGGAKDETTAENNLVTYTKEKCDAMKANGVVIYTIGFGVTDTGGSPTTYGSVDGDLLKYCATDSTHYFLAPTNAALATAFSKIGSELSKLRITK